MTRERVDKGIWRRVLQRHRSPSGLKGNEQLEQISWNQNTTYTTRQVRLWEQLPATIQGLCGCQIARTILLRQTPWQGCDFPKYHGRRRSRNKLYLYVNSGVVAMGAFSVQTSVGGRCLTSPFKEMKNFPTSYDQSLSSMTYNHHV